ncbi:MAG: hypothetical protein WC942_09740 [Clostridia bacterium]|jgi:hypothetical protein
MVKPREQFIGPITVLNNNTKISVADTINANLSNLIGVSSAVLEGVVSVNNPGSNKGTLWVSSESPTVLKFTDSSGNTITLGSSGGVVTLENVLAQGNVTNGNDVQLTSGDSITGTALNISSDGYISAIGVNNYIIPLDGNPSEVLSTDGYGQLSWVVNLGGESLSETLSINNTTNGNDIVISLNDNITSPENINLIPDGYTRIQSNLNVDGYIDVGVDSDINFGDGAVNIYDAEYIAFYNLDNSNRIMIRSPDNATSYILNLPENSGISGQILSTDGSGILSWIDPGIGAQSFSNVLSYGNNTDGYDIIISENDLITSENGVDISILPSQNSSDNGGTVYISGGISENNDGGNLDLCSGYSLDDVGSSGYVLLYTYDANDATSGELNIWTGNSNTKPGDVYIDSGNNYSTELASSIFINAGLSSGDSGTAGDVVITGGEYNGTNGSGGNVSITGGLAASPGNISGSVNISAGPNNVGADAGKIYLDSDTVLDGDGYVSGNFDITGNISVGSIPSSFGNIRLPVNANISARNNTNDDNINIISLIDSGGILLFGDTVVETNINGDDVYITGLSNITLTSNLITSDGLFEGSTNQGIHKTIVGPHTQTDGYDVYVLERTWTLQPGETIIEWDITGLPDGGYYIEYDAVMLKNTGGTYETSPFKGIGTWTKQSGTLQKTASDMDPIGVIYDPSSNGIAYYEITNNNTIPVYLNTTYCRAVIKGKMIVTNFQEVPSTPIAT